VGRAANNPGQEAQQRLRTQGWTASRPSAYESPRRFRFTHHQRPAGLATAWQQPEAHQNEWAPGSIEDSKWTAREALSTGIFLTTEVATQQVSC
jgi:hypothetical protein